MMSIPSQSPPLKEIGTAVGRHLHPMVSKSEPGVLANSNHRGGDRDMVTVAIKIQANHETHHVKVTCYLAFLLLFEKNIPLTHFAKKQQLFFYLPIFYFFIS